jgi:general secretion pathway protein I
LSEYMFQTIRASKRSKKAWHTSGRHVFSTTGFTLIEVVVAMAILGVALTVIIELFSGGLRLARTSAEYTKAINYARIKMEEIAVKQTMEEGIQEGEFDHTFRWQVETKKMDVLPIEKGVDFRPPTELFQVKVNVLWKSGSKERSTRLETYRTIKLEDEEKKS